MCSSIINVSPMNYNHSHNVCRAITRTHARRARTSRRASARAWWWRRARAPRSARFATRWRPPRSRRRRSSRNSRSSDSSSPRSALPLPLPLHASRLASPSLLLTTLRSSTRIRVYFQDAGKYSYFPAPSSVHLRLCPLQERATNCSAGSRVCRARGAFVQAGSGS